MARLQSTDRLRPLLIAVSDLARLRMPVERWSSEVFDGGVDLIQIREPGLTDDDLRPVARQVIDCVGDPHRVQLNDRVELARALGCGVHVPERSVWDVSGISPTSKSVHDRDTAEAATGFDFLIAGHIFETPSHAGTPGRGTAWLNEVSLAASVPVVAIGGIDESNAALCLAAGADGVAVIRALTVSDDPRTAATRLRCALDEFAQQKEAMMDSGSIEIVLNGKHVERPGGSSVQDLLADRELVDRLVVVEINGSIIPRSAFADTVFRAGDIVELVHFVGGG